jgi:membrane-associated phospholipid phosphatase
MNTTFRKLIPLRLTALALATALAACGGNDDAAVEVTEWNRFASDLVAADQLPPVQARSMAIVQIAVHDALNAIEPRYAAYQYTGAAPGASLAAAVAAATRDTLLQLQPSAATTIEAAYTAKLASIPGGPAKDAGIAVGQASAAAILARRSGDDLGAAIGKPYAAAAPAPGVYQPTPPLNIVIGGGIGDLAPFALGDAIGSRSPAPLAVSSGGYAEEYREVKEIGADVSSLRTPHQTETARFWYDAATREWHTAARRGLADNGADEWQAARTLALVGMAMFDVTVASLETKFHFNYWRPITAIRAGDDDANDATQGDPNWAPLCITPPFPEYNSTHAATGAAAAGVLARTLGDRHTFSVESRTLPGVSRAYGSFSEAAAEEGVSRIYCGIHFRNAMDAGIEQGDAVAAFVATRLPTLVGERYSIADIYLFNIPSWLRHVGLSISDWPALAAHSGRVGTRAAVQAALKAEAEVA